ncbi:helix-turn-helix domain-containing protein [Microbacterium kunmingense]|uniref:helix-turn-helix domain-containing protein n=1 Tax=Microbacterium kunmingense TaxID=2915939 RepID=UPI003D75AEF3
MPKKDVPTPEYQPRWGTIVDAAEEFGICTKTVRRWIAGKHLSARRIGPRLIQVDLNSINQSAETLSRVA